MLLGGLEYLLGKPTDNLTILLKTEFNSNRGTGTPDTPTPFSPFGVIANGCIGWSPVVGKPDTITSPLPEGATSPALSV